MNVLPSLHLVEQVQRDEVKMGEHLRVVARVSSTTVSFTANAEVSDLI